MSATINYLRKREIEVYDQVFPMRGKESEAVRKRRVKEERRLDDRE